MYASSYVGYTQQHLFQCLNKHIKYSAIGKHTWKSHSQDQPNEHEQFNIFKKCRGKLKCLIYEMLVIKEERPNLDTLAVSRVKVFN